MGLIGTTKLVPFPFKQKSPAVTAGLWFCVPNMFDSLGVKVPCPTWWR